MAIIQVILKVCTAMIKNPLLLMVLLMLASESLLANDMGMSIDAVTTYGARGARRPSGYSNCEVVHITIKCKGFLVSSDGPSDYVVAAVLSKDESVVIHEKTVAYSNKGVFSRDGGRTDFYCSFDDRLPQVIEPGNYNYRITLKNKAADESAHVELPIHVYASDFPKLINVAFWRDSEESIAAGSCFNVSETVYLACDVHDIAMVNGKGDVEIVLALLDSKTRRIVAGTKQFSARSCIDCKEAEHQQCVFSADIKGAFWLSCRVIDHIAGKETTLHIRLSVNDSLDLP